MPLYVYTFNHCIRIYFFVGIFDQKSTPHIFKLCLKNTQGSPEIRRITIKSRENAELDEEEREKLRAARKFREAEYFAMISHAIAGGIESPIQFILQLWLILNGKVPKPWDVTNSLTITDWSGNQLILPTTSAISLFFSVMSIAKAVVEFNIIRMHVENVKTCEKMWQFLVKVAEHLPFYACSLYFRLTSIALFLTYLNEFGFLPIVLFWIANLIIGYMKFDLNYFPLWLISFIALFFPAFFTSFNVKKEFKSSVIDLQYKIYWRQCVASAIIYFPGLFIIGYLINARKEWGYDANVILNNTEFNVHLVLCGVMGLLSLILSSNPNSMNWFRRLYKYLVDTETKISRQGTRDETEDGLKKTSSKKRRKVPKRKPVQVQTYEGEERDVVDLAGEPNLPPPEGARTYFQKKSCIKVITGLLFTSFVMVPIFIANLGLYLDKPTEPFVYWTDGNNTMIMKGVGIVDFQQEQLSGCLVDYFSPNSDAMREIIKASNCRPGGKVVKRVLRSEWRDCLSDRCFEDATAVIIVDDNKDCGINYGASLISNSNPSQNCFRPSQSNRDLTKDYEESVPLILVQAIDNSKVLPKVDIDVHIALTNRTIHTPYKCNHRSSDNSTCLPYKGTLLKQGYQKINGQQLRTVKCYWGNRPCFGYENKPESQDFCEDTGIEYAFCHPFTREELTCTDTEVKEGKTVDRKFSVSPARPANIERCITRNFIKKCDENRRDQVSRWSNYIQATLTSTERFVRFCQIRFDHFDSCIIVETTESDKKHHFHGPDALGLEKPSCKELF